MKVNPDMAVPPESPNVPASGWSARLYWLWILYNSAAFVVVLTTVAVLAWIGADVLHLSWDDRGRIATLLVATLGALLFGGVLGALQWLVVRRRAPVPRKRWIVANVGPALVGWLLVIIPAVTTAEESGTSASGAYLLAASQTLALGPLLGLSQASVLRPYTRRWGWWIGANLGSWLLVNALSFLLSSRFEGLDLAQHDGSVAQVYLMLIATTPLTGRALLWVLAPGALTEQPAPTPAPLQPGKV
jgi:hypothetical protein